MTDKASCSNCKYAIFQEEGYSNYTVEGCVFTCALGKHPDGSFDRWYGEDKRLNYVCDSHSVGDPIEMDVECENLDGLTPEQRRIYEMI